MRFRLPPIRAALAGLLVLLSGAAVGAEAPSTIIVLDGSGSMWGKIDGETKLETARKAVAEVLKAIPPDQKLGLMAYGHRSKGDCADIELLVPPAAGTAPAVSAAVSQMRFLGKTPLSAAVRQAAEALRYTEEPATVVLITDGLETCSADPCALGAELEAAGVGFTAHVIGFGLSRQEGAQVACLAQKTGGRYIEARNGGDLAAALTATVAAPALPPPAGRTLYPGAEMMPNVGLDPTGMTAPGASTAPAEVAFPPTGTIARCKAACDAQAVCAAWRYEPKGSYFVDHARCFLMPYSTELDIRSFDAADGWASGMKPDARLLVRPYGTAADGAPVEATFLVPDGGETLAVTWSATPVPGQSLPAEAWAMQEAQAGPVTELFVPGTYDILGEADGRAFAARVTIQAGAENRFVIPARP